MEDWALRAMARWPNVPALFGWLSLDRRGRWRIRGELISRPQITDTFDRNYAADEHGRWYFQNGPQRGYVQLETAPLVLRAEAETLRTHNGLAVASPTAAWLDEDGGLWLATEHGPAALSDQEAEWLLVHLHGAQGPVEEAELATALALPAGSRTDLWLKWGELALPLHRLTRAEAPQVLGFAAEPQPLPGEKTSERAPD
ncbi:DUF2946 family protein [Stagnimonas aquatica]|uniref:DUF2946 family protein n=1 Tax=Stagnimonas aquatica TaxID=2689987 RepID=A0A3N0VGK1_9GAMM|nr:DUF2946 family protein [Stagnimonas aquatica]ROH91825.1 DUF2946 family protein [Stagnimonas aquatica]